MSSICHHFLLTFSETTCMHEPCHVYTFLKKKEKIKKTCLESLLNCHYHCIFIFLFFGKNQWTFVVDRWQFEKFMSEKTVSKVHRLIFALSKTPKNHRKYMYPLHPSFFFSKHSNICLYCDFPIFVIMVLKPRTHCYIKICQK